MQRCASSFVIAAYAKVRLTPQDSRAWPADFLRSRPVFTILFLFYEFVTIGGRVCRIFQGLAAMIRSAP
jgi:hypothetical protein